MRRFARPGDSVWVHDFQLMLLPQLLREKVPEMKIGYFIHIPWPASELFRLLPWREEILHGLLGADLIGFHTDEEMFDALPEYAYSIKVGLSVSRARFNVDAVQDIRSLLEELAGCSIVTA